MVLRFPGLVLFRISITFLLFMLGISVLSFLQNKLSIEEIQSFSLKAFALKPIIYFSLSSCLGFAIFHVAKNYHLRPFWRAIILLTFYGLSIVGISILEEHPEIFFGLLNGLLFFIIATFTRYRRVYRLLNQVSWQFEQDLNYHAFALALDNLAQTNKAIRQGEIFIGTTPIAFTDIMVLQKCLALIKLKKYNLALDLILQIKAKFNLKTLAHQKQNSYLSSQQTNFTKNNQAFIDHNIFQNQANDNQHTKTKEDIKTQEIAKAKHQNHSKLLVTIIDCYIEPLIKAHINARPLEVECLRNLMANHLNVNICIESELIFFKHDSRFSNFGLLFFELILLFSTTIIFINQKLPASLAALYYSSLGDLSKAIIIALQDYLILLGLTVIASLIVLCHLIFVTIKNSLNYNTIDEPYRRSSLWQLWQRWRFSSVVIALYILLIIGSLSSLELPKLLKELKINQEQKSFLVLSNKALCGMAMASNTPGFGKVSERRLSKLSPLLATSLQELNFMELKLNALKYLNNEEIEELKKYQNTLILPPVRLIMDCHNSFKRNLIAKNHKNLNETKNKRLETKFYVQKGINLVFLTP